MGRLPLSTYFATLTVVILTGLAPLLSGCGSFDLDTFMADNACDIFNCQTLFFIDDLLASTHDDMDGEHDDMDDDHVGAEADHDDLNNNPDTVDDVHDDMNDIDDEHDDTADTDDEHDDTAEDEQPDG